MLLVMVEALLTLGKPYGIFSRQYLLDLVESQMESNTIYYF